MKIRTTLALLTMLGTAAIGAELAPELKDLNGKSTSRVIVRYRVTPNAAHEGRLRARGAKLTHRLDIVRGEALSVDTQQLEALLGDPDVESIVPDREVKATLDYA